MEALCDSSYNKCDRVLSALYGNCLSTSIDPDISCRRACSSRGYSGIHCCKHYDSLLNIGTDDECWCGAFRDNEGTIVGDGEGVGNALINDLDDDDNNNSDDWEQASDSDNLWRFSTSTVVAPTPDLQDDNMMMMITPTES